MSDELDPALSQWFAQARRPLPGDEFEAHLMKRLAHSRGWLSGHSFISVIQAACSGIATGLLVPFKLRPGYSTAMVVTAAALTVWISLQTP
jgi:hypothetical protein